MRRLAMAMAASAEAPSRLVGKIKKVRELTWRAPNFETVVDARHQDVSAAAVAIKLSIWNGAAFLRGKMSP